MENVEDYGADEIPYSRSACLQIRLAFSSSPQLRSEPHADASRRGRREEIACRGRREEIARWAAL